MANQLQLENAKYRQWVKAGLGFVYLKEGLTPFCDGLAKQQHRDILDDIRRSKSLHGSITCGACHLRTLTPDHVKVGHKTCPYRQTNCNCCFTTGKSVCSQNICGAVYDLIIQNHASIPPAPYWKNTDAQLWTSDPWSIAKCFINAPGYDNKASAADTDCAGLLHVIINNKYFHNHISAAGKGTISKVREHRNKIFHSSCHELDETIANSYIDDMIAVLTDGKELVNQPYAKQAVHKLNELKKNNFIITSESHDKLLKQIHTDLSNELEDLKSKVSTKEEVEGLKNKISSIEQLLENKLSSIEQQLKDCAGLTRNLEKRLAEQTEAPGKRPSLEEDYEKAKSELKEKLIKFYKADRSTVPLSPLVDEVQTPLAGFYVMPDMVSVKQKTLTSDGEERIPVKSLSELFITGSEGQQQIYLSADAGFGKTSLSKYLAITWSQAFSPDNKRDCFKDEEINTLATFEFLFLILLRDSTAVCSIDEMIERQIIKKLPKSDVQYPLQKVLDKEKCLIILDGLDEWTHPENGCDDQNEKIPHRYARDNCVILTTTRPWKLGVSNLKTNEINKKVELVQLSEDSMHELEKNAISKMSGVENDHQLKRKVKQFNSDIVSRGLQHMQAVPLLLMYITCLWCNNIPIGDSKTDVYIKIIEFLLSRTAQKHPEVHPSSEPSESDIPDYLKTHKFCQKFYSVLTALAELAYRTLFSDKMENTLVFDGSVAEKYLEADDMKICLLSGILTESTTTTLMERKSKVSFSHKTVQEFFAAMFISSHSNTQETVLEKCKNVQSILDKSMICEFLSKMNSNMMCEIWPCFMPVINEDEKTRDYRNRKYVFDVLYDISSEPLYNIQKMLLSCLKEMPESENIKLCLQDFFIDKDTIHDKNLQRLSKLNQTNMKSLYIDMFDTSSSFREILELFSLTDLNNLQKLHYHGARKEADISLLLSPCLQTVSLWSATSTKYEGKFCEKLVTLKHVKYLYIGRLTLSHKILEIIFNFISGNKTIEELTLEEFSCKEHGRDCLMKLDLSENSQLKKLGLWKLPSLQLNLTTSSLVHVRLLNINLDESSLLLSRDMLNIERVVLSSTKISAVSFREFIKVLENLPQTVTVKMTWCDIKPETEDKRVRNYIRRSQTFVVTRDDWRFVFQTRKPSKE